MRAGFGEVGADLSHTELNRRSIRCEVGNDPRLASSSSRAGKAQDAHAHSSVTCFLFIAEFQQTRPVLF